MNADAFISFLRYIIDFSRVSEEHWNGAYVYTFRHGIAAFEATIRIERLQYENAEPLGFKVRIADNTVVVVPPSWLRELIVRRIEEMHDYLPEGNSGYTGIAATVLFQDLHFEDPYAND